MRTLFGLALTVAILWTGFGTLRSIGDRRRLFTYGVLFLAAVTVAGLTAPRW